MFSNFKGIHLIYVFLGLALIVLQWVTAQNATGNFALSAQILAGVATAITVVKTIMGLLQSSTSDKVNAKAAAAAVASSALLVGILALLIFAPRQTHTVVGSAMQENGSLAFVEIPSEGCQNGTITPQTQADIAAAEQLGQCIESTYASDSQKVPAMTPTQIALDEAAACGADVVNLVTVFGAPTVGASRNAVAQAAQANAAAVHAAALSWHGAKAGS